MTEHAALGLRRLSPRRTVPRHREGAAAGPPHCCCAWAVRPCWPGLGTSICTFGRRDTARSRPTGRCSCSTRSPGSPSPRCCWRGPGRWPGCSPSATPPPPSAPCSSASAWACSASGSQSRRHTSPNPWPSRRSPCSPSSAGPSWRQPSPAGTARGRAHSLPDRAAYAWELATRLRRPAATSRPPAPGDESPICGTQELFGYPGPR